MSATFLGFDFGLRRIGVAVGQRITCSASPVTMIQARDGEPDWTELDRVIRDWQPDALVVGIPLLIDGKAQPITGRARSFANRLRAHYGLTVHEADERLSSRAAREVVADGRAAGARGRTRKGDLDRIAATLILQHWLESRPDDAD